MCDEVERESLEGDHCCAGFGVCIVVCGLLSSGREFTSSDEWLGSGCTTIVCLTCGDATSIYVLGVFCRKTSRRPRSGRIPYDAGGRRVGNTPLRFWSFKVPSGGLGLCEVPGSHGVELGINAISSLWSDPKSSQWLRPQAASTTVPMWSPPVAPKRRLCLGVSRNCPQACWRVAESVGSRDAVTGGLLLSNDLSRAVLRAPALVVE